MRILIAFGLLCASACAQDLSFYVDPTNGSTACSQVPTTLTALSASTPYQFPDTPVGSSASLFIQIVNVSSSPVLLASAYVGATAGTSTVNPNFTVSGLDQSATIAPGSCSPFTLTFAPITTGSLAGYLQAAYSINQVPNNIAVTTLEGNGLPPQLTLTCSGVSACSTNPLQPSVTLSFGTLTQGAQVAVTFTIANEGSSTLNTPTVALQTAQFLSSPFSINTSTLPATLAPGASGTFTMTFAPTQVGGTASVFTATLSVGANLFPLQGVAVSPTNNDPLQVCYTDAQGDRVQPNSASPINFTPVPLPANATAVLNFVIVNPNPVGTSYADITLPTTPSLAGGSFAISGMTLAPQSSDCAGNIFATPGSGSATSVTPGQSVDIQPGWGLTFQITFTAGQQAATGTLTIPTVSTFSLVGSAAPVALQLALMCGSTACPANMSSDQQVQATLALQANAQAPSSVLLSIAFTSAVKGISDDSAVTFISPFNVRTVGPISFTQGSTTGTFSSGQSQFTFQTGTTAGTITFTATDSVTSETQTWKIRIAPTAPVITSSSAQWQSPSLLVTLDGYDNTYSVNSLSYTFYDTNGNIVPSSPLPDSVVESDFHTYFFGPADTGGMFGLQANFPVSDGNVTQIGSVAVTMTNSAGATSTARISFQ